MDKPHAQLQSPQSVGQTPSTPQSHEEFGLSSLVDRLDPKEYREAWDFLKALLLIETVATERW